MISCQTVSDNLWDWLHDGAGHPLHSELDAHVAGCDGCRAHREAVAALRSTMGSLREPAPAGFAEALQARLAAGMEDSRFEADPWLDRSTPPAQATLVDRRHPAWWRPVALVATGAAAVLVFGLVARWQTAPEGAAPGPALPTAELAVPEATSADSVPHKLSQEAHPAGETGLLAERPYDGDSSQTHDRRPEGRERLTPVGVAP